ncbi:hypothetical protein Acy02nite_15160 [Actinoplanes cyaneus]|uniref:Uncharacterized protein n=1 Tax=Actinoplanes cyaneus TaxID=52696 RepID=A0A919LZ33_9ACTN|nr:hypothetical protein Acy02nite_15160 [Actinoplanes cyaneus]
MKRQARMRGVRAGDENSRNAADETVQMLRAMTTAPIIGASHQNEDRGTARMRISIITGDPADRGRTWKGLAPRAGARPLGCNDQFMPGGSVARMPRHGAVS